MRATSLLTFAAALALSASALAAPAVTPDASGTSVMSVSVPGATHKMRPAEFEGVQGTYQLKNGQVMQVTSEKNKLFVEFNGAGKTALTPVAVNTFVAGDEDTKLEFDQIPFANNVTLIRK
jgi:hypothetical protein